MYVDLPVFLKRDLRRLHGTLIPVGGESVVAMRAGILAALAAGRSARVDGIWLRVATREESIRQAARSLALAAAKMTYYRRGDVVVFEAAPS